MKTRLGKIIFVILLVFSSCVQAVTFTSDGSIQAGDIWSEVYIYDTPPNHTTVTMTGGIVGQSLRAYDASTLNVSGGNVSGGIGAYDESTVNVFDGSIHSIGVHDNATANISNDISLVSVDGSGVLNIYSGTIGQINGNESAIVNVYGGDIGGFSGLSADGSSIFNLKGGLFAYYINAGSSATINIFGYDLAKTNTGGMYGVGQASGFWQDGTSFTIDFYGSYTYSAINLIPEPMTLLLFVMGIPIISGLRKPR